MKTALKLQKKGYKVVWAMSGNSVFVDGRKYKNITQAFKALN